MVRVGREGKEGKKGRKMGRRKCERGKGEERDKGGES